MTRVVFLVLVLTSFSVKCFDLMYHNEHLVALKDTLIKSISNLDNIREIIEENKKNKFGAGLRDICPNDDGGIDDQGPSVYVPELGSVRGRVLTSFFGREFYAFHSIPYAKPPIGDLRYKMTEPWEGEWDIEANGIDGEYDGTYFRAKCPQPSSVVTNMTGGREDCLFVSIYTPNTIIDEPNKKYPVMFFIHGGSFIYGDASFYIPTKLMDEDVVVVTVQYRLGTLGFLASLTPDNPGNMGLMDQVTALRWVQKYISYFNGDASSITVFGQSAGAASASWFQFTNATTADNNDGSQLYHRAILHSGSALEMWAEDKNPYGSFQTEAEELDCWNDSTADEDPFQTALDCMRAKPFQEIVDACIAVYLEDRRTGGLGFLGVSPVVQSDLLYNYPDDVAEDPELVFIRESPLALIKQGDFLKVPMIAGSVRDEGSLVLGLAYDDFLLPNGLENDEDFLSYEILPFLVDTFGIVDTTGAVSNSIKLAFLKYADMGSWESMSGGLVDSTGMLFLKTGLWTLTQQLTMQNPDDQIFFYSFEFEGDDSLFDWFFSPDIPIEGGITHADDLLYLFCQPALMDQRQQSFIKKITKLWRNFAKCGNPTPTNLQCDSEWQELSDPWKPFSLDFFEFLLMQDELSLEYDFTLRWNHNTISDPRCQNNSYLVEDEKSKENPIFKETKQDSWKIAALSMGAACFLLLISIIFILLMRS